MKIRNPNTILNEIHALDSLIVQSEILIKKFPEDNLLRLSSEQDKFKKNDLIDELKLSIAEFKCNSIELLVDEDDHILEVEIFSDLLKSFKSVFSKTIDYIMKGEIKSIPLYVNTVFEGSFGILLTTEYEEKLFCRNYDEAIEYSINTIENLINIEDDKINSTISELFDNDKKVIKKYYKLFKNISENKNDIVVNWISSENIKKTTQIRHEVAHSIYLKLEEQKSSEEVIIVAGYIKGISLLKYTVEIQDRDDSKNIIYASFDKNYSDGIVTHLDKLVNCTLLLRTEYIEHSEREKKSYSLVEFTDEF